MLSRVDRYRDALRATQLIARELADITDADEYETKLAFVLNQGRNVRQRTGPNQDSTTTDPVPQTAGEKETVPEPVVTQRSQQEDTDPLEPTQPSDPAYVELSQPHSLWSEEMGDVS